MREYIDLVTKATLEEARSAPVYHGIKHMKHALMAIEDNRLLATTSQRFWPDGRRRRDNEADYQSSYWMKGISTTRDIRFAQRWGCVVLVLDQLKLASRFKIVPFNWGFSIPDVKEIKREREEFVVLKATPDNYQRSEEDGGGLDFNRFMGPEGEISPLSNYLLGILVDQQYVKRDHGLTDHPKFLGYYES